MAYRHQLSHQQANHAVKETTGLDLNPHHVALAHQLHLLNRGSGMGPTASGPHESTEVVKPEHAVEGIPHAGLIQSELIAVPAPGGEEQVGSPPVVNGVAVTPVGGRVAGMPILGPQH